MTAAASKALVLDANKDIIEMKTTDNGPGIPQQSVEKVFGQLLFGSRFHAIRQSRGQQGIGITGVVMYSQLTTGRPTHVRSKIATEATASVVDIGLDTRKNKATKSNAAREIWEDENGELVEHGLEVTCRMKAKYQKGRQSVWQYLRMTSIVNPHADITFIDPEGEVHHWPRVTERLPRVVESIKPHPRGIHLGQLQRMCNESQDSRMTVFLRGSFSGVSSRSAKELCEASEISEKTKPKGLKPEQMRSLLESFQGERLINGKPVKLLNPPTNCLSPIEELLIKKGLSKTIDSRFIATLTRAPEVTQGNPYQVEVGLIFGGNMPADKPCGNSTLRQQSAPNVSARWLLVDQSNRRVWIGANTALTNPVLRALPKGPAAILVHLASTNVQFTSEAKGSACRQRRSHRRSAQSHARNGQRFAKASWKRKRKWPRLKKSSNSSTTSCPLSLKNPRTFSADPSPIWLRSITKIMSAVISETQTTWNKETKMTDVSVVLFNYTSRARSYTILCTWPEKFGATLDNNELGGRKEATGVWAWKLATLDPGERITLSYSLGGLEKGDWTETDVFYRGSQEVIGASKMDEKFLDEIRQQEKALKEAGMDIIETRDNESLLDFESDDEPTEVVPDEYDQPTVEAPEGQQTLFGGGN